eukprot:930568-Prymnesium_polylepis.1
MSWSSHEYGFSPLMMSKQLSHRSFLDASASRRIRFVRKFLHWKRGQPTERRAIAACRRGQPGLPRA